MVSGIIDEVIRDAGYEGVILKLVALLDLIQGVDGAEKHRKVCDSGAIFQSDQ